MKKRLLFVVIVFFALYLCGKSIIKHRVISTVKNGYFTELETDVTIGKMMKTVCKNNKWKYVTTDSGNIFVTFEGKRNGKPVEIDFFITSFAGTTISRVNRFSVNGTEVTGDAAESMAARIIYKSYIEDTRKK